MPNIPIYASPRWPWNSAAVHRYIIILCAASYKKIRRKWQVKDNILTMIRLPKKWTSKSTQLGPRPLGRHHRPLKWREVQQNKVSPLKFTLISTVFAASRFIFQVDGTSGTSDVIACGPRPQTRPSSRLSGPNALGIRPCIQPRIRPGRLWSHQLRQPTVKTSRTCLPTSISGAVSDRLGTEL